MTIFDYSTTTQLHDLYILKVQNFVLKLLA